jgi:hypothetical protein
MAKETTSKTEKRATKIENLAPPDEELTPEQAEAVQGGSSRVLRALGEMRQEGAAKRSGL